jgi:hypothetical protein
MLMSRDPATVSESDEEKFRALQPFQSKLELI